VSNTRLLWVGYILLLAGMVGLLLTTVGVIGSYREVGSGTTSAHDLAQDISGVLSPAVIGAPLALIGLILVLCDFFFFRPSRRGQA